jgi:hypothetical protein
LAISRIGYERTSPEADLPGPVGERVNVEELEEA